MKQKNGKMVRSAQTVEQMFLLAFFYSFFSLLSLLPWLPLVQLFFFKILAIFFCLASPHANSR